MNKTRLFEKLLSRGDRGAVDDEASRPKYLQAVAFEEEQKLGGLKNEAKMLETRVEAKTGETAAVSSWVQLLPKPSSSRGGQKPDFKAIFAKGTSSSKLLLEKNQQGEKEQETAETVHETSETVHETPETKGDVDGKSLKAVCDEDEGRNASPLLTGAFRPKPPPSSPPPPLLEKSPPRGKKRRIDSSDYDEVKTIKASDLKLKDWQVASAVHHGGRNVAGLELGGVKMFESNRVGARRHQITWLAQNAIDTEGDVLEASAQMYASRQKTAHKYGW